MLMMVPDEYYKAPPVLYKLGLRSKARELAFLGKPSVRALKAHNSTYFSTHLTRFKGVFNLYSSVASLFNMPMLSYNLGERLKEQQDFFKSYNDYVINYDLVFDFDSSNNIRVAFDDCMIVRELLLTNGVACEMIFSGSKGFHLEVRNLPEVKGEDFTSRVELFRRFAEFLKDNYKLSSLDLAVYDYARIWKIAYSIDHKTGLVALPLNSEEIGLLYISDDIRDTINEMCSPDVILPVIRFREDFYIYGDDSRNIFKLIKEVMSNEP